MPLQQIKLTPGVNQENTRYASEGKWYESNLIRFRQGTPETIGGWVQKTTSKFIGVCRSLFTWSTLSGIDLIGIGTNLKFYIDFNNAFFDITPIRSSTVINNNPFATINGSKNITVTDTAHGAIANDFVTYSGATAVAGLDMNAEFQITTYIDSNTYVIQALTAANATTSGGGAGVTAAYQINTGPAIQLPILGWGAGYWGTNAWGNANLNTQYELRTWTQSNFGEDLIFGPRYGGIYFWDSSVGTGTRAVNLATVLGAADVPIIQQGLLVTDRSRFLMAFGCNDIIGSALDPMLIRWSDQEVPTIWTPLITNQAGSLRLSVGSEIRNVIQTRQEILVWTESALYSLQYIGAPLVWSATLIGANITNPSPNGAVIASGVAYWIGNNKFYMYDGRIQTLKCDLRAHVFNDINIDQAYQTFSTSVEAFNEVWWFYCSKNSTTIDKYVVYNYLEQIWYYGDMARTAWLDTVLDFYPISATYDGNLLYQENGVDDGATGTLVPLNAFITSSQFDIGDGHQFAFIWRMLPDITFNGSTSGTTPQVTMSLLPLKNSGSGYTVPPSLGGSNSGVVARVGEYTVDQFTGQINTRIRARQISMKIESNTLGTKWQLGYSRIDIRPDGRSAP